MRSPADARGSRVGMERVARSVALGVLLGLAILAFRDRAAPVHLVVRMPDLPRALIAWSTSTAPAGVHVRADGGFAPFARDWLRALAGAGTGVTWEGTALVPTALAAEPVADPEGGTSVWIAAPAKAPLVVEDAAGRLDSIQSGTGGARVLVRSSGGELFARSGGTVARSAVTDSLVLGRLLLLGRAGWESKFVAAALEERGWRIDARLRLSPRGDVRQGAETVIDTARYSAVVVLDSIGAAEARRVAGFVRSGGGIILSATALRTPGLAGLAAGSPGSVVAGHEPFDSAVGEPRRELELIPIALRTGSVLLEHRDRMVAVAARRIERGRAVTIGYLDTWRWRMGGGAAAVRAHRDWWADLVAGVAHSGRIERPAGGIPDEAPLATLIARLGPASSAPSLPNRTPTVSHQLLFAILMAVLLAEWASRRLRGMP